MPGVAEPTRPTQLRAIVPLGRHGWAQRHPQAPGSATHPRPTPTQAHLEAAWLGRAAGCLLGKPVEKLPLSAIRQLAKATGNWPLNTYFTARGVPPELLTTHPWNRRSAPTSLAENIDGMPEDDDLNYPLLNLLLLQRHGSTFTTTDLAKLWLDELPAGRTFTAERLAYRNLLTGLEPPHTARHRNPFREWIGALIRADVHGWTNPGNPSAAAEQAHRDATLTHTANGVYRDVHGSHDRARGHRHDRHPHRPPHRPPGGSPRLPAWPRPSTTRSNSPEPTTTSTRSSTHSTPPTPPPTTGCTPSPTRP